MHCQFSEYLKKLQALELEAMQNGIILNCKWAVPLPASPLSRFEHCSEAELQSVLGKTDK